MQTEQNKIRQETKQMEIDHKKGLEKMKKEYDDKWKIEKAQLQIKFDKETAGIVAANKKLSEEVEVN